MDNFLASKKLVTVLIILFAIAVALSVLSFNAWKKPVSKTNQQKQPPVQTTPLSSGQEKTYILNLTKIPFPPIATKTAISKTDLPQDLQKLIPADATGLEVYHLDYKYKIKGFLMQFDAKADMLGSRAKLSSTIKSAGFSITYAARGEKNGFFEFKNKTHLARFLYLSNTQSPTTSVKFQSISQ